MFDRHIKRYFHIAATVFAIGSSLAVASIARAESVSITARLNTTPSAITDGTHVYGSATQPQQIGETYMVFEAQDDRVVGGFYQPSSSFDCFQGNLNGDRLALTVTNSYTQAAYPFHLAVTRNTAVAGQDTDIPLNIPGFQPLDDVSSMDRQVLDTCQTALAR